MPTPQPCIAPSAADGVEGAAERAVTTAIAGLLAENDALRAEAARVRRRLDSATDHAVVTMNLGGRITGWNAGARRILGHAEAEILGRSGAVLLTPEDRADGVFVDALCRALDQGRAATERWHLCRDGARVWVSGTLVPLLDDGGRAEGFLSVFRDDTARRREEERRELLLAEMGHRMRNTFATVQAIATQTLGQADIARPVRDALAARLVALARAHDLLIDGDGEGAPLAEVVERALLPYGGEERAALHGPPVRLPAGAVEMLGLAFHELATNAAKYGALSVPNGDVEVQWSLRAVRGGTRLVDIRWHEQGGPAVAAPTRRGFGLRLLERGLVQDFGGSVSLRFEPPGVRCHIHLPLRPRPDRARGAPS